VVVRHENAGKKGSGKQSSKSAVSNNNHAPSSPKKGTGSRVYVGNLSWTTSWQDLKDFMSEEVGNVTYVKVLRDRSGRSKGCGIVEFEDAQSAADAIEKLNDIEYDGRVIFVREDREP